MTSSSLAGAACAILALAAPSLAGDLPRGTYEPPPEVRAQVEREVAGIAGDVAAVRGRPWKRPVRVAFARPASEESRVSGFYRWGSDTITLVDVRALVRRPLVAHELTHALQDQYADLARRERGLAPDAAMAASAAIEGEAHAVALGVLLREAGLDGLLPPERWPPPHLLAVKGYELSHLLRLKPGPSREALPPVERDPFLAPYIEGVTFVTAVMKARGTGFSALDEVLEDPPATTAEVLHPEAWLARRDAGGRAATPVAPRGRGAVETLGEWRIRALLLEAVPRAEARRAAAGWVGDWRAVETDPASGVRTTTWTSVWATDGDAREFLAAYRNYRSAKGLKGGSQTLFDDRSVVIRDTERLPPAVPKRKPPKLF